MPLPVLQLLGLVVGWAAFLVSGRYRRTFLGNARQAGLAFGAVWPAVGHAGMMLAELPRLWFGAAVRYSWANRQVVDDALARGGGVLFLTPHLGGFEISPQAMAREYSATVGPMTVLFRPARKAWLTALVHEARSRPGLQAVPTTLAGVRQILRALKQGRPVGMLPDQVPPAGMGDWAPFFGRPAYTMTLAARLWTESDAELVVARVERLPWARGFRIHLESLGPGRRGQPLPEAMAAINQAIETHIRRMPHQYLWGYARYKQPRVESAQGGGKS